MNELMEAIYKAALENIVALLNDPDPQVRLETSLGILQTFEGETRQEIAEPLPMSREEAEEALQQVFEPGEVLEAVGGEQLAEMSEEELAAEAERQAAAAQALRDAEPHSGRSSFGSGEQRR